MVSNLTSPCDPNLKKVKGVIYSRKENGSPVTRFERDLFLNPFDSVFDDLVNSFFNNPQSMKDSIKSKKLYPKTDIVLYEDRLVYELAVPGINREDIIIEYDPEEYILSIKYDKKGVAEEENLKGYYLREMNHSSFLRLFLVPKQIIKINSGSDVKSSIEDGVLKISFPILVKEEKKIENKYKIDIK